MQAIAKSILLTLGLVSLQQSAICQDLTEQLRNEYTAVFNNTRANYTPEVFDKQITHLIINENSGCPVLYGLVQELATKLEMPTPQILIFKDPKVYNAFAMQPNRNDAGSITICAGLITHPEHGATYNELKAVLAHELAHIKHQHLPKRVSRIIKGALFGCASTAVALGVTYKLNPELYQKIAHSKAKIYGLGLIYSWIDQTMFLKFCRSQEKEADLTSAAVTQDPTSLINFLDKADQMTKAEHPYLHKFFNTVPLTHPSHSDRTAYLKALMPA